MQRRIRIVVLLVIVVLPLQGSAEGIDDLDAAVDAWGLATSVQSQEQLHDADESLYQQQDELFPDVGDVEEGSVLEQQRDERISQYVSVEVGGKNVVFRDVERTAWFAPYIREIASRGIVSGYADISGKALGFFGPQDNVTVEQMAKVMLYASGRSTRGCPDQPTNLTASGSWSGTFIACAETWEWSVYNDGSVDVHRNATRAEVVGTLLQAMGANLRSFEEQPFEDTGLALQFGTSIAQAKADGIVSGYTDESGLPNGLFGPDDPVTRAEFAKMVTLGMQVYGSHISSSAAKQ